MGADTAGRTDAFTRGNRMGHPIFVFAALGILAITLVQTKKVRGVR
jgi:hypothetical protein